MLKLMLKKIQNWTIARIKERTTADGLALIVFGVVVLIAKPIAGLMAYAAIGYGAWTIYKSEL